MILDPPVYAQHFVDTRRSTGFRKRITFDVNEKFDRDHVRWNYSNPSNILYE